MKEATGEVSMTVVTLVAIAVIGAILAAMWTPIRTRIGALWNNANSAGQYNVTGQSTGQSNRRG